MEERRIFFLSLFDEKQALDMEIQFLFWMVSISSIVENLRLQLSRRTSCGCGKTFYDATDPIYLELSDEFILTEEHGLQKHGL